MAHRVSARAHRRALPPALVASLLLASFSVPALPAHAESAASQTAKPAAKPSTAVSLANLPGPDGGVSWGRAEGIIDAKPDDVLAIIHDYGQYAGLFPHFEKSKVLSQRGTDAIVYLEAKIIAGVSSLWGQVRMSSTQTAPDLRVVEAKMMKGKGNMAQLLARWEVRTIDAGKRAQVAFQLLVDPDLPVPDMVVSNEMKNSAGMAFRALRKRLSQAGTMASRTSASM
ncbi:MAG: SRPBCC family protein [Polyangiales bacterium]